MAHSFKTALDVVLAALLGTYLFLVEHWVPAMNGVAATLVAATCALRLASAWRDYRRGRPVGEQ